MCFKFYKRERTHIHDIRVLGFLLASFKQQLVQKKFLNSDHIFQLVYNNKFGGRKPCMVAESGGLIPSCFGKPN
jgi:hypothetical protein